MDGLSLPHAQLLYASSIIAVAYLIRGMAGFGASLISVPLLLLLNLPIILVVPLATVLDYVASASLGISHRKVVAWREIWPLLPFTFIGVAFAIYLFKTIEVVFLQRSLAAFIILYAVYTLLTKRPQRIHSRWWAIPAGSLGGLIGTLFGVGGPFYAIYLQLRRLDKTPFIATFASIFLIDGAGRITGYLLSGFFTLEFLWLLAVLLPVMLLSLYLGGRIHLAFSQETFKRIISVMLVVSGVVLLLK